MEPIALEPLVIQSGDTDTNSAITAREKDLLYAGGGFEGDGQKTIPVKEGMYILVAGVLVYALIERRRLKL
jgi:hypothetical protein